MYAPSCGGKSSSPGSVACRTGMLMPTDSTWIWRATQSAGIDVGDGVGAMEGTDPLGLAVGLTTATGLLGSGMSGRLGLGRASRANWPTRISPTPATASSNGSTMPGAERRLMRRSLASELEEARDRRLEEGEHRLREEAQQQDADHRDRQRGGARAGGDEPGRGG